MFFEAQSLKYLFSTMQDVPRLATVIQLLFIIPMALFQGIINIRIIDAGKKEQEMKRKEKERLRRQKAEILCLVMTLFNKDHIII